MPSVEPEPAPPTGWLPEQDQFGHLAVHPRLGLRLRWIGATTGQLGLSEAELAAARHLAGGDPYLTVAEMTPVVEASIGPLWISEVPVSAAAAGTAGATSPTSQGVALVTIDEALTVCASVGARLPTEAEWELVCRGGTTSLFIWGDTLPPPDELTGWLAWDLVEPFPRNGYGIGGMFLGEWCADPFTTSHAPDAPVLPDTRVVKGGGARFWPWQDQEWVWCLPSMRMPSTDLFDDGRTAFRLVIDG